MREQELNRINNQLGELIISKVIKMFDIWEQEHKELKKMVKNNENISNERINLFNNNIRGSLHTLLIFLLAISIKYKQYDNLLKEKYSFNISQSYKKFIENNNIYE